MRNKIYWGILALLFVGVVLVEYYSPKPIDWTPTYDEKHKIPYGCYVLKDILSDIFPGQDISEINKTYYLELDDNPEEKQNLIAISSRFNIEEFDLNKLLSFVDNGNRAFIAADFIAAQLLDTLGVENSFTVLNPLSGTDSIINLQFTEQGLNPDSGFVFTKNILNRHFYCPDSLGIEILGTNQAGKANFIKVPFGKGFFLLHSQANVFTNYHILYSNHKYASTALSYLPVGPVIWDQYYKPGSRRGLSPLRYILSNFSLKAGYFVLLFGLIVYVVFLGKRTQRVIPLVKPLENNSLGFVKTVGKLFLQRQNHKAMAEKKFTHFIDFVHRKYFVSIALPREEYIKKLVAKSGYELQKIESIFETMDNIAKHSQISQVDLLKFNELIEEFYGGV